MSTVQNPMQKPLPVANAETRPYWDAAANHQLLIQRCADCGHLQFYPRLICSHCSSRAVEWHAASGRGTVKSFTIIRRAVSAAFEADVPYVVALVLLEEGPTMMSNIVECDAERVHIGMAVSVTFELRTRDAENAPVAVPQFRPTSA